MTTILPLAQKAPGAMRATRVAVASMEVSVGRRGAMRGKISAWNVGAWTMILSLSLTTGWSFLSSSVWSMRVLRWALMAAWSRGVPLCLCQSLMRVKASSFQRES